MRIKFVEAGGAEHEVEVTPGLNAMEAALHNGVPGIDADCGGNAACGTCHILVDRIWFDRLDAEKSEHEEAMIELIEDAQPNSRLACQITLKEALDGLVLHLPEAQF
jgi:ferredoxin, 2Fe-2S